MVQPSTKSLSWIAGLVALFSAHASADITLTCNYAVDDAKGAGQIIASAPDACAAFLNNSPEVISKPLSCPVGYTQYGSVVVAPLSEINTTRNGQPVVRSFFEARRYCLKK